MQIYYNTAILKGGPLELELSRASKPIGWEAEAIIREYIPKLFLKSLLHKGVKVDKNYI